MAPEVLASAAVIPVKQEGYSLEVPVNFPGTTERPATAAQVYVSLVTVGEKVNGVWGVELPRLPVSSPLRNRGPRLSHTAAHTFPHSRSLGPQFHTC